VKELKMQRAQEMTPLGKEINPNIKDTEHEGLKRVYKPTTEKIKRKMK